MTLDDLRDRLPLFGLAVYAYEPHGDVVLELLFANGATTTYKGRTVDAAIAEAVAELGFGPVPQPEPVAAPDEPEDIFG